MVTLTLPADALVVLVGASGAGKSTFASRCFRPTEILSSDAFRAIVADDEADQGANRAAFELLHLAARRRLERGRLTVIDATNVVGRTRSELVALATTAGRDAVAIVFDLAPATCRRWNATRPGRIVDDEVVDRQLAELSSSLAAPGGLEAEGFAAVHRLTDPADLLRTAIVRTPASGSRTGATAARAAATLRVAARAQARPRRTAR